MAIIEAYQCDVTGKKFFIKEEYETHCRIIKNKQKALKMTKIPLHVIENKFHEMRTTCGSFKELNDWIADNLWVFTANGLVRVWRSRNKTKPFPATIEDIKTEHILERIELRQLSWMEKIHNTHCSPMESMYGNNFIMKGDKPDSFPGWRGKISITKRNMNGSDRISSYSYSDEINLSSGMMANTGLNTGSGGGGYYSLEYTLFIFACDFPKLMERAVFQKTCGEEISCD